MISDIDLEIAKIRQLLEEEGIAENTVIILMGDNGYFLGERQLAGKWLMYEPSLRVPLIIYDPRENGGRQVDDLALNIDIPSTIFEYAGINIPSGWQGLSLASYSRGDSPAENRESFVCEHLWDFENIPPSEGIRTLRWKYFRYRNDPSHEELYDLQADPDEQFNLANKPELADTLSALREKANEKISELVKQRLQ
jgi:arylsulfatase A-like enzyme